MKKITIIIIALLMHQLPQAQDTSKFTADDLKLYPLLFQQSAAEYRALCYQAFNIARMRLDDIIRQNPRKKNLAVITDLDETILDNSSLDAQKIKTGKDINPKDWLQWLNKPGLPVVPGGVDFLQYAGSKGIYIFYISNRSVSGLDITLSVLQKLRLPDADTMHMLFRLNDFSKEPRRKIVMKDYDVVMLLGDNLSDFSDVFDGKSIADRFTETDAEKDEWGKKFIVLPNPVYGDWQSAIYNYNDADSLSVEQRIEKLKALLKGF